MSGIAYAGYSLYAKRFRRKESGLIGQEGAEKVDGARLRVKAIVLIGLIALMNCGGGIMLLYGASQIPASALFPAVTGGTIVLTSIAGKVFFKEKITPLLATGLVLSLIGTILICSLGHIIFKGVFHESVWAEGILT